MTSTAALAQTSSTSPAVRMFSKPVPFAKAKAQFLAQKGVNREETCIIAQSEINALRGKITAGELEKQSKAQMAESKQKQLTLTQQHRERIQKIDEERARKGAQKAPEEIEEELKRSDQIKRSKRMIDEDSDEVKYMNKLMLYAKCVTIRDAQLDEKKAIVSEKKEEEKRLDMMMEMERLKALKMYEERESKRIEDRKKGASVIRAQMEEREQERLRQQELKQQEQEAMLRHIERMKLEDKKEQERKREASQRLMEDVALANAEQIRLKTRQRETEIEEERRITEYIREKERREQEIAEDQERVRTEKEREIARLRSMQERAQDKQAEVDALRAKRAQESYEREWRQKERAEAERVQRIHADLAQARDTQRREKEMLLAEQAVIESEEFERIIAVQRAEDAIEREKRHIEKDRRRAHADELKEQIFALEEKKAKDRREFIEEGHRLRKLRAEELEKIERIRQEKLQHLEEQGVPSKYRNELTRKRATIEPLKPSK